MRLALVGNPNVGKSLLFNTLTGGHARVGNWSGVTVHADTASKGEYTFIDLPGLYSLDANTRIDEQATKEVLAGDVDVIINVIDATQLERQLFLTSELLELNRPMVIYLTMLDKAHNKGIQIDTKALSQLLGCTVLSTTDALESALKQTIPCTNFNIDLRLRGDDITNTNTIHQAEDDALVMLDARYQAVHDIAAHCEHRTKRVRESLTDKIDKIVLHRVLALPIFFAVMYAIFFVVIGVGGYAQERIMDAAEYILAPMPYLKGLGFGVATLISFIPVMGLMFFLLASLEASGYMARVAFVTDRIMRALGLPGKAFVPLVIGFGCNVPAVMAARTLESETDRKLVMMMSPFMSCSARLTIYTAFVAVFFPDGGYNIVFSLYLMGILVAIFTGVVFRKVLFKGETSPLLLELPEYQLPNAKLQAKQALQKLQAFLWRAGYFIIPICVVLNILGSIELSESTNLLAWFGQMIQPLFAPMGISRESWPAVVGLMTGVFAKEVVMSTLNSLYTHTGGLHALFDNMFAAYAYLLFILLYVPCASTMAVIKSEAGRRLMWLSIGWSTLLAYATATFFYQLATFSVHPGQSVYWLLGLGTCFSLLLYILRKNRYLLGGSHAFRPS